MKLLISILVVSFSTATSALWCTSYVNAGGIFPQNITCTDPKETYCLEIDMMTGGSEFKWQGCSSTFVYSIPGGPLKCAEAGIKTLDVLAVTGQYYCCNGDNCNTKQLDPKAKPNVLPTPTNNPGSSSTPNNGGSSTGNPQSSTPSLSVRQNFSFVLISLLVIVSLL